MSEEISQLALSKANKALKLIESIISGGSGGSGGSGNLFEAVVGTRAGYLDKGHSAIAAVKKVSTRVSHIITEDIEEIAFVLGTNGTAARNLAYNVHGIVYDSKGNIYPITVGGESDIRVEKSGVVKTDYVKCNFKKDEIVWSVWCVETEQVNAAPAYIWLSFELGEGIGINQDWTLTGKLPPYAGSPSDTTTTNGYGYAPVAVLGKTRNNNAVSAALIGDSILDGVGENQPVFSNDIRETMVNGYVERGLRNLVGFSNLGVSNEFVNQFYPNTNPEWTYKKKFFDVVPYNVAVIEYPINDIKGGKSVEDTRGSMKALITFLKEKGIKVIYLCTVTPVTTSTDKWVTTENQTVTATEAARVSHNTDVRSNYYNVSGYFEAADKVETSRNSGIWKANTTADGIHPQSTGVNIMKTAIEPDKLKQSVLMIN